MSKVIKPFGVRRRPMVIIIVLGVISTIFSAIFLWKSIAIGYGFRWFYLWSIAVGLCVAFCAQLQLKMDRYYIEWFDDELHYFMPKCSHTVKIKYKDIVNVEIEPTKVLIQTSSSVFTICLEKILVENMASLKENFKELVH